MITDHADAQDADRTEDESTFDTAGAPAPDGLDTETAEPRPHHDAATDADTSSGAPDAIASDASSEEVSEAEPGGGTADTLDGALSPGSTAESSPTGRD